MGNKLFAVYLGGTAPKANMELHDVVFVVGEDIEATYPALLAKWFGAPEGLHLDCWKELDVVDGHEIQLVAHASKTKPTLYFINVGAYVAGQFMEAHANGFLVAQTKAEAKQRGKAILANSAFGMLHTDNLHAVDDCLALKEVDGYSIRLVPTDRVSSTRIVSGYQPLPEAVIARYLAHTL